LGPLSEKELAKKERRREFTSTVPIHFNPHLLWPSILNDDYVAINFE
jgi:hypothetical protein